MISLFSNLFISVCYPLPVLLRSHPFTTQPNFRLRFIWNIWRQFKWWREQNPDGLKSIKRLKKAFENAFSHPSICHHKSQPSARFTSKTQKHSADSSLFQAERLTLKIALCWFIVNIRARMRDVRSKPKRTIFSVFKTNKWLFWLEYVNSISIKTPREKR